MEHNPSDDTLEVQGFTPYAQVPKWLLRAGRGVSSNAVRLYGVIMTYADNASRTAFPGRKRLAEDMVVQPRSISTYIRELEDYGAPKVIRGRNQRTGHFYTNHYVVRFDDPCAKDCTTPGAEKYTPRGAGSCRITTPTGSDLPPF